MGMTDITVLHALERGKSELSPSLEAESSSLGNSSRMACSDSDPLWAMPSAIAPELARLGDRLKLSGWLAVNSRSSKWMTLSWVSLTSNKRMSPVATMTFREKSHYKSPFLTFQLLVLFHRQEQGGQVTPSSFEMVLQTIKYIIDASYPAP
jgi:hypothetical protein